VFGNQQSFFRVYRAFSPQSEAVENSGLTLSRIGWLTDGEEFIIKGVTVFNSKDPAGCVIFHDGPLILAVIPVAGIRAIVDEKVLDRPKTEED